MTELAHGTLHTPVENAVKEMRKYLYYVETDEVEKMDSHKKSVDKLIKEIIRSTGESKSVTWDKIEAEARKRGMAKMTESVNLSEMSKDEFISNAEEAVKYFNEEMSKIF